MSTRYYSSKLEFYLAVSLVPLCSCIAVATLLLSHSCFCTPLPSSLFLLRPRCTYIHALSILFHLCSFSRFAAFVLLSLPSFSFTMRALVLSKLFLFSLFHVRTVRRIAGLARALSLSPSGFVPDTPTSRLPCPRRLFFLATAASVLVLRSPVRVCRTVDVCSGRSSLSRVHVPRPGSSCSTFPWPRLFSRFISLSFSFYPSRAARLSSLSQLTRSLYRCAGPPLTDSPLARSVCPGVYETRERLRSEFTFHRKALGGIGISGDGTRTGLKGNEIWPVTYRHVQDGRRLRTRSEGIPGCCTGRTSLKASAAFSLSSSSSLPLPCICCHESSTKNSDVPDKRASIINTRKWWTTARLGEREYPRPSAPWKTC